MTGSGNTMGGETPRIVADAYYTPDALALAIAQRVREAFGEFASIVEPSAGGRAFVRAARATQPDAVIHAIEPNPPAKLPLCAGCIPRGCALPQTDCLCFSEDGTWEEWDPSDIGSGRMLIIGNPPYNLPGDGRGETPTTAEKHVRIALDRMRYGDVLAFLLRSSFLGGGGRIDRLHLKHPLAALWTLTPRPSFTTDGKTDGSEYGVFVWVKGHSGLCDVRPLRWIADAKRRTA